MSGSERREEDAMGWIGIPEGMLYGAGTARALRHRLSDADRLPLRLIHALARIKGAAAEANHHLGLLDAQRAGWIGQAAAEIIAGALDQHFPLGAFQTGSGTSTNMNVNEVIANRCAQLAGLPPGRRDPVHPNDHVNLGQSSNDVFPSAVQVAAVAALRGALRPALERLRQALAAKAAAWADVVTIGRTHLQDAVPLTLGQRFGGYARQMALAGERAGRAGEALRELPLGGTAVGTGINTHPRFAAAVCARLAEAYSHDFREAVDHFEAQGARDAVVEASGLLKTIAVGLSRIASDIRLLGSGPRCGLGELVIPALQPGSSIMPGKVNPVVSEAVVQAAVQVVANDAAVTHAAFGGVGSLLDLNVAMPVMARNLLESIDLLAGAAGALAEHVVEGLESDPARCADLVARSLMLATALVPALGYDQAAAIAKAAWRDQRSLRDAALASGLLPEAEIDRLLDPRRMLQPGDGGVEGG